MISRLKIRPIRGSSSEGGRQAQRCRVRTQRVVGGARRGDKIRPRRDDAWIGVGSGSTANFFIDELAKIRHRIKGAVASSVKTAERLKSHGIPVDELNNVGPLPVYIDDMLARYETVYAAAGSPNTIFPIPFATLVAVLGSSPISLTS